MAKKETDTIKRAIAMLIAIRDNPTIDACELDSIRALLSAAIVPAPAKPRGIEAVTVLVGNYRMFIPADAKSAKAASETLCALCKAPAKFGRLAYWWRPGKMGGWAHAGCVVKAEIERDRIFAELDANRRIEFDAQAAQYCACTHHADRHEKDELENMLKCKEPHCDCDHFRMATPAADPSWVEVEVDGTVYDGDMIDANEMEISAAAGN
jgi:hypothetical protein